MVRAGDLTVIGDWDGDGVDNIGVYRPGSRRFYLDDDDNGIHDHGVTLGIEGDTPVTGDWNGDGKTDVGFFKPCENTFYPDTDYNGIIDKIVVFSDSGGMDDDKIAVVAGIADYKDNTINPDAGRPYIPDLNYADNDAESIRDLLQRNGWQTVMLTDSSATKAAVESAIKSGTANASRFLFFFSGHGTASGYTGYICPHDSLSYFYSNDISEYELENWLAAGENTAETGVVIIDACYSGSFIGHTAALKTKEQKISSKFAVKEPFVCLEPITPTRFGKDLFLS